jgi:CheY-like chemotaxis protein
VRNNATMKHTSGTLIEGRTIQRPNGGTMSKKLLLADDSVVIQKLVGLSFANEDVEIVSTDNGDDAVRLAREVVPDVVLADVVMPGKSGYEVCEAIKQDAALAHIPVLLLTGTFEAFDEARAEASGANGQITKPFEAQALVSRVTEVMNAPVVRAPAAEVAAPEVSDSDFFDANVTSLSNTDSFMDLPAEGPSSAVGSLSAEGSPSAEGSLSAEGSSLSFDDGDDGSMGGIGGLPPTEDDFMLNEPGESRSALFGKPSDVMAEDFGPEDPGASPSDPRNAVGARPATPPSTPPAMGTPPKADAAPVTAAGSRVFADPLEGMSEEFGLHEKQRATPGVSARDVDSALAAGSEKKDATILVAEDDANARTYPARTPARTPAPTAFAQVDLETRSVESKPSEGDARSAAAPPPIPPAAASPATSVADLDERLARTSSPASPSAPSTPRSASESMESDFLDLGPTSLSGDDLDFAFDVSEHLPISETEDPLEQSYSSLSDISDSQILGDPSEESVTRAADYDVSSSDLATAPPPLPPSHEREPAAAAAAKPLRRAVPNDGLISVDEDAAESNEAMQEAVASRVEDSFGASRVVEDSFGASPVEDSFRASPVEDSFKASPVEDSFRASPVEDSFRASPVEDSTNAPVAADSFDVEAPEMDSLEASSVETVAAATPEPIEIEEDVADAKDEFLVGGLPVASDSASRSVPDLSPMMERQIQETLEKVAWEAFSDLSESIVKEVMGRVEKIAWEVIPQMAETLVREEIRRMKGEDD